MLNAISDNHTLGFIFAGLSSFFWTVAYALIVRRGFRDKTFGMPLVALSANITWEILFLSLTVKNGHLDSRLGMLAPWAFIDGLIAYQCFMYGRKDFKNPIVIRFFVPAFLLILGVTAFVLVNIVYAIKDMNGWYTAYGQNLLMSALFVAMILRRDHVKGQSIYIGIAKFFGTFFAFLFALGWSPRSLHEAWPTLIPDGYYPISKLIVVLYAGIFILDLIYIALILHISRRDGIQLWSRA